MMRKLISCKYHEDSQTVELLYTDGTLIDIDCMAVEDEVARNMYGDVIAYLRNVTDYRSLDEREY